MKVLVSAAAIAALAGAASADFTNPVSYTQLIDGQNGVTVTATPIDEARSAGDRNVVAYENLDPGANGYVAFSNPPAAAGEFLGFDDYGTGLAGSSAPTAPLGAPDGGNITLAEFQFIGGINAVGDELAFAFFDNAGNPVNGFSIALSQAGNFIWTITLGSGFDVPAEGLIRGEVLAGTGQWFLGDAGPTVGYEDDTFASPPGASPSFGPISSGAGTNFSYNFALVEVPAPGALAVFGLGGLAAARRRRA